MEGEEWKGGGKGSERKREKSSHRKIQGPRLPRRTDSVKVSGCPMPYYEVLNLLDLICRNSCNRNDDT